MQIPVDTEKLTPLMRQFWEIKSQHMDKVLLFRMGDFYEMFHEDAKRAAPILNIALTSRNKKSEDDTPMCGVPHHSISGPIGKLLAAGLKVAICDQLEDPELAKGIVKRGVTRTLSPSMVYDPDSLEALVANYVAAFDADTLSFLDASTGEGFYYSLTDSKYGPEHILGLLTPVEILLTPEQDSWQKRLAPLGVHISFTQKAIQDLPERFEHLPLSAKRLVSYTQQMQGASALSSIGQFEERSLTKVMVLSDLVLRHLEIFKNTRGEDRGSLYYAINRTKTSAGARLLKDWLRFPLMQLEEIQKRQNKIELWNRKPGDLKILRETLARLGDIERRLAKISYNNCHVRDLVSLAQSLSVGQVLSPLCDGISVADKNLLQELIEKISRTVVDNPPLNMKHGGYIKEGVSHELDEIIGLTDHSEKLLLDLEAREKEATGITSLKVRYNNVFGYYIEVTNTHKDKVPDHYKRKQTLANAERYLTQELHELETKLLSAKQRRLEHEERIFQDIRATVLRVGPELLSLAKKWSELDVLSSLAWLSLEQKYVRPEVRATFSPGSIRIENSRHPVVEQEVSTAFVANTIHIEDGECLLLTGPNMAGKSTLMRQVAVTAILTQIGAFVPATKAQMPILDQIFTRIGASDSLSEGLSTFMVEMKETAEMLKGATSKSLVVLDEVGRGTSTYDGMSLAQAILEFLVREKKAYTLFATHYHEITELAEALPRMRNAHMSVHDHSGQIRFLYVLKEGPANKSYGIKVAELAGLPKAVVSRAAHLLNSHEARVRSINSHELPLFNLASAGIAPQAQENLTPAQRQILDEIQKSSISSLTPLEALNRISEWQKTLV